MKAFTSVEPHFYHLKKFISGEQHFFSNRHDAREYAEELEEENNCLVEVNIIGELFNVYKKEHRSLLLSALPEFVQTKYTKVHKEMFVIFLMGLWQKDQGGMDDSEMINTEEFFDLQMLKDIIFELGFDGYISMRNLLGSYLVFDPNKNVEVLRIY